MSKLRILFKLVILLGLTSCSSKIQESLNFNPAEPLRVAVIPFYQVEDGEIIPESFNSDLFVDNVPLISSKLKDSPASLVEGVAVSELKGSGLELISPGYIRSQLGHHGYVMASKVTMDKLLKADTKQVGNFLGADALLFGKLTRWSRNYYGVQSVVSVALELKLVRTADGVVLFSSSGADSDSRGLTGIPTGFSSIVLEPIRALDNDIIVELSQKLIKKMLRPLSVKERPEYVNSSGPAIFGAVHTGLNGFGRGVPLVVVALGTPEREGYFTVGREMTRVPMIEVEKGHYIGRYLPVLGERLEAKSSVTVELRDSFGRTAEKKLPAVVSQ